MSGLLTIIPTPIADNLPLESQALELLKVVHSYEKSIICVEEAKVARRKWIKWGLPRETIEKFVLFNEHTAKNLEKELIEKLQTGHQVYLMSDGGLPAFCDPGQSLINHCHHKKIKVTATSFPHSIALALSLSGFQINQYVFAGFPPKEKEQRSKFLKSLCNEKKVIVLMDTPYRLERLVDELSELMPKRIGFLALNLNMDNENLMRSKLDNLKKWTKGIKGEFILVLDKIENSK